DTPQREAQGLLLRLRREELHHGVVHPAAALVLVPAHRHTRLPHLGREDYLNPLTATAHHGHDGALGREHDHLVARARAGVHIGVIRRHAHLRQHLRIACRWYRLALPASLRLALCRHPRRDTQQNNSRGRERPDRDGFHTPVVNTAAWRLVKSFLLQRFT